MPTVRAGTSARWSASAPLAAGLRARTPTAQPADRPARARWVASTAQRTPHAARWPAAQAQDAAHRAAWAGRAAPPARAPLLAPWLPAKARDASARVRWPAQTQPPGRALLIAVWPAAQAADTHRALPWPAAGITTRHGAALRWQAANRADATRRHPWGRFSQALPAGWMVVTRPPGVIIQDPYIIAPARFYMAVHSLTAVTVPGGEPVPIYGVTLSADAGSYAWQFTAQAPRSVFDQLAPVAGAPQQIRITLDGIPFLFAVDRLSKTESFGRADATIAGRSITAALSRPFARELTRTNTSAANAQQLAAAALDLTGFALDWGIVDWLVPAGAWSHTSTPLAAVQAIAEAAGAYVQSARNAAAVLVRHPYPAMQGGSIAAGPWNWDAADPDVVLAPDAVVTTAIERQDGADINAVYVCGTNAGVRALVKRTGTAGDKLSAMVTDPLITAEAAARQRGTAIVGAAGAKQLVTIELPLLTAEIAPGVLDVGQLIEIDAAQPWRGMVRAVNVSAQFGRQVRQTATVERHLNE